jgi:ribonuclease HI
MNPGIEGWRPRLYNQGTMTEKHVRIYTDGACEGNPGPGGIGFVILYEESEEEFSQGYRHTTNNRMELLAAIAGLESLKENHAASIYSDSKYLVDAVTQGWALAWRENGYIRKGGVRVPNADLWERLLPLIEEHEVHFSWVKGHAGDPHNERADHLSYAAIDGKNFLEDEGYLKQLELEKLAPSKITQEGQPCRKCGTPVVKKKPRGKPKPSQSSYYEYYLFCPQCETRYFVEKAKRGTNQGNLF